MMQDSLKTRSLGAANSKDNTLLASRSCPSLANGNNQVEAFEIAGTTYYQNICNEFSASTSGEFDFNSNSVNSDLKQFDRRVENNFKQSNLKVENNFKPFKSRAKDDLKQSDRRARDNLKQSNRRASSARPYPLGRDKGDRSPWPKVSSDHCPREASFGSSSGASYGSSSGANYGSSSGARYGSSGASIRSSSLSSVLNNRRFPSFDHHWPDNTDQNFSRNRISSSSAQNWPKRSVSSSPNLTYINRDYDSFDQNWQARTSLEAASELGTNQQSWTGGLRAPSWPRESLADKASNGNLCSVRSHTNLKQDAIGNDSIGNSWAPYLRTQDVGFQSSSLNWSGVSTRRDFWDSSPTSKTENRFKSSFEKAGSSRSESRFQTDVKSGWNTSSSAVYSKQLDNRGRIDTSFKQSEWPIQKRSFENPSYLGVENNESVTSVSCPKHYTKSGQAYVPIASATWHSRRNSSEQNEGARIKRLDGSFSGDAHREGARVGVEQTGQGSRPKSSDRRTGNELSGGGTGTKITDGGIGGLGGSSLGGGIGGKLSSGGTGGNSSSGGTGSNLTYGGTGSIKSLVGGSGSKSSVHGPGCKLFVGEVRIKSAGEMTGGNSIYDGPGSKSGNESSRGIRPSFKSRIITNSFINIDTIRKAEESVKETTDDKIIDASGDDYLNQIEHLKVKELKGQEFNLSLTKVLIDVFEPIMSKWKQFVSANEEKEGVLKNDTEDPAIRDNAKFELEADKPASLFVESSNIQPAVSGSPHFGGSCIASNKDDHEDKSNKVDDEDPNAVIDDSSLKFDLFEKCYSPATGLRLIRVSSSVKYYRFSLGDRGDIHRFLSPFVTEIVLIDKIFNKWKSTCVLDIGVVVEEGQSQLFEAIQNANSHFGERGFQFNPVVNSEDVLRHLANTKITPKVDSNGVYQITIKFRLTQGTKEEMDRNEWDLSKELVETVNHQGVEKISVGAGERILQLGHNKDMLRLSEILKGLFEVSQTKHVWVNKAFEEKTKEISPPLLAHQKQDNIVTLSMSDAEDDSNTDGNEDMGSSNDSTQTGSMSRETFEERQDVEAETGSSINLQEWTEEIISNLINFVILKAEKESLVDPLDVDSDTTQAIGPSPDSEMSNETCEYKYEFYEIEEGLLIAQGIKEAQIDSVEEDVNWFGKVIAISPYQRDDKSWDVHVKFETSREMEAAYLGLSEKYTLLPKLSESDSLRNLLKEDEVSVENIENSEETIENTEGIKMREHDPIL